MKTVMILTNNNITMTTADIVNKHLIKPLYNTLLHYYYIPMILGNNIIMKRVSMKSLTIGYNLVNKVYKHHNICYIYFFIH